MGRNNQQRRAAKARQRQRVRAGSAPGDRVGQDQQRSPWAEQQAHDEALSFLGRAARMTANNRAEVLKDWLPSVLEPLSPRVREQAGVLVTSELTARLAMPIGTGWEPRDLLHVAGRVHERVAALAAELMVHHLRTVRSPAPAAWTSQVTDLDDRPTDQTWRAVGHEESMVQLAQAWGDALALLKLLAELVPLGGAGPRGSALVRPPARHDAERDRLLHKVRSLLAKAEATEFAGEAESFTAKAQQLMSRHAIDEAMLRSERGVEVDVIARRVHLQAPYATVKASLLNAVAVPNRCRVVLHSSVDIATVVGTPFAVEDVEMLFTSLLVQATRAMTEAGRRPGSYDRSTSFRRAFLMAYAVRIGERLEEADQGTAKEYGAELVPVLQRETAAVDAEYERLFPNTSQGRSSRFDARGWSAGRSAADRATLVSGRLTA